MKHLLLLTCTLLSYNCAQAQSLAIVPGWTNNGQVVELIYQQSPHGAQIAYGSKHQWLYTGHTAWQAEIIMPAVPASPSSKNPTPAIPQAVTLYTSYAKGLASFQKLP